LRQIDDKQWINAIMSLKKEQDPKVFFSIKEVAQMVGLNAPTLRFWEKEFKEIAPRKNAQGSRFYDTEDIRQIRLIHYLLKVRGMTLAGARQKLKDNKEETVNQVEIYNRLEKIRSELLSFIDALDAYDKHQP
jgi:DNA-binding transcriptional MerR regulator